MAKTTKTGGRPKITEEKRVQVQFRIDPSLRDRLAAEAERRLVSQNLLIEKAVEFMLSDWENEVLT